VAAPAAGADAASAAVAAGAAGVVGQVGDAADEVAVEVDAPPPLSRKPPTQAASAVVERGQRTVSKCIKN